MLQFYRKHVRVYVDDIVIFFKILKNYIKYFYQTFNMLNLNNISLQLKKVFIDYLTI